MRTKKRWYFVWMLVFVMLVFAGCGEKPKEPVKTGVETMDGQQHLVEKALKKIVKKMESDGQRSNDKKIQRSLAKHILKDHVALMAHFQSQQWEKMEKVMGSATVYKNDANGNPIDGVPNAKFWEDLYIAKKKECPNAVSIELEIYADDISLNDIELTEDEEDCESTEDFLFRIICIDKDGNEISNQSGGGSRGRRHSRPCPWI